MHLDIIFQSIDNETVPGKAYYQQLCSRYECSVITMNKPGIRSGAPIMGHTICHLNLVTPFTTRFLEFPILLLSST